VRRLLVAIAGPTGAVYGIRLLERLREIPDLALHLVLTEPACQAIPSETEYAVADVKNLADHVSEAAAGSVPPADGMVIAACDIATASAVATGRGPDLIAHAAADTLARGHPLIVLVHQSPLGADHLQCLLRLTERGAIILPPMPAFYDRPQDIEDIVLHTVARVIDRLGLPQAFAREWQGSQPRTSPAPDA
jgi:flavin prenyltransferase